METYNLSCNLVHHSERHGTIERDLDDVGDE